MSFLDRIIINPEVVLTKGEVYPFIDMANVSTSNRQPDSISERVFAGGGARFQYGDTVIARIEPCLQNGKRFFCDSIEKGFGSTEYLVFRPKDHTVNSLFLYYFMQQNSVKQAMVNSMVGATGRQRVNNSVFVDLPFDPPRIEVQTRIASILSAYDSLIETNQRQIKLLEEAAQRLYKEWFVDLRFPGHEDVPVVDGVPEGWKVDRADCFFDISIGKTPPRAEKQWFVDGGDGIPWVSISDMGDSGTFIFETSEGLTREAIERYNVKVVPTGTIFVSFKLTVGRVSIATVPMCTNEAIAHFRIDDPILREYTFSYLRSFEYDELGNTSSISKAVNSKIIKALRFIMPDTQTLEAYSKRVAPVFDEIFSLQALNQRLSEARDRLLPKLMSGEIAV